MSSNIDVTMWFICFEKELPGELPNIENSTKSNFENHINGVKSQIITNAKDTSLIKPILQVSKDSKDSISLEDPLKKPLKNLNILVDNGITPLLESRRRKLVKKLDSRYVENQIHWFLYYSFLIIKVGLNINIIRN
jgi:hypothetical protein